MEQELLRVAEIIAKAREHPAPISRNQYAEFEASLNAGDVEIKDDQIAFTTPELLADWLARYCASDVAGVWHDFAQTIRKLRQVNILFRTLGLSESATTQLFLSLENDFGKSVLSRLSEAALIEVGSEEPNIFLNAIYLPFCDALPRLDYQPTDLADQLGPVLTATESYSPPGKLHGAIEELAKQSPQKAESLLEAFLQRPEQRTAEFAANVLKVLWTFNPSVAHNRAMELTNSKLPAIQRIGTLALAWFSYELPLHEEELIKTINHLEEQCESNETTLLPTTAQALGTLVETLQDDNFQRRVREGLLRLSSHKDRGIRVIIARYLNQLSDGSGDADWFWEALDNLAGASSSHERILGSLDLTTYSLVERHPERVVRHLQHVVTNRSFRTERERDSLSDTYENTVVRLIEKQQPMLESAITLWFASRDIRLHQAAADIVGRFIQETRRQQGDTIRLSNAELNKLDEEDVHRVICALAGHLNDFKALATLLISVLSREPLDERTHILVFEALVQVVLYNIPSIGGYFRDLTADSNTSEIVCQVVEKSLACSDTYYAPLEDRPRLKELLPPDSRVHRYDAAHELIIRHHRDKILNESGFLSMIPTVPTKYGRSTFSAGHGKMTSPIPMRSFTTEIDWPRELVIDPLGWEVKRRNWKYMAIHGASAKSTTDAINDSQESKEIKKSEKA